MKTGVAVVGMGQTRRVAYGAVGVVGIWTKRQQRNHNTMTALFVSCERISGSIILLLLQELLQEQLLQLVLQLLELLRLVLVPWLLLP